MLKQSTVQAFIVKRLTIELRVELHASGLVKVAPYQCREENMRLWSVIAKTQNVLAQMQVEQNKQAQPFALLQSHFHIEGWEIITVNEGENKLAAFN